MSSEGLRKSGELTISFVGDEKIKGFNKKYRGHNKPTDVLAFDASIPIDRGTIFADIMVSVDTAIRNARIFKTTPLYELYLYVIHGFLHLLGYSDKTKKQRNVMHEKEQRYLNTIHDTQAICPFIKPKQ